MIVYIDDRNHVWEQNVVMRKKKTSDKRLIVQPQQGFTYVVYDERDDQWYYPDESRREVDGDIVPVSLKDRKAYVYFVKTDDINVKGSCGMSVKDAGFNNVESDRTVSYDAILKVIDNDNGYKNFISFARSVVNGDTCNEEQLSKALGRVISDCVRTEVAELSRGKSKPQVDARLKECANRAKDTLNESGGELDRRGLKLQFISLYCHDDYEYSNIKQRTQRDAAIKKAAKS